MDRQQSSVRNISRCVPAEWHWSYTYSAVRESVGKRDMAIVVTKKHTVWTDRSNWKIKSWLCVRTTIMETEIWFGRTTRSADVQDGSHEQPGQEVSAGARHTCTTHWGEREGGRAGGLRGVLFRVGAVIRPLFSSVQQWQVPPILLTRSSCTRYRVFTIGNRFRGRKLHAEGKKESVTCVLLCFV